LQPPAKKTPARQVSRHSVILVITDDHFAQPVADRRNRRVPMAVQLEFCYNKPRLIRLFGFVVVGCLLWAGIVALALFRRFYHPLLIPMFQLPHAALGASWRHSLFFGDLPSFFAENYHLNRRSSAMFSVGVLSAISASHEIGRISRAE
jgi:hypothetical protein